LDIIVFRAPNYQISGDKAQGPNNVLDEGEKRAFKTQGQPRGRNKQAHSSIYFISINERLVLRTKKVLT
jgi:hypothetical protein